MSLDKLSSSSLGRNLTSSAFQFFLTACLFQKEGLLYCNNVQQEQLTNQEIPFKLFSAVYKLFGARTAPTSRSV